MRVQLAKSLAGHDRNHVYVIYKEENDIVFLINGETKTMEKPKKKKKMHIQLIKKLPYEVESIICGQEKMNDSLSKEILKAYATYQNSGCESI